MHKSMVGSLFMEAVNENWSHGCIFLNQNDLGISMTVFQMFNFCHGSTVDPAWALGELIALPQAR